MTGAARTAAAVAAIPTAVCALLASAGLQALAGPDLTPT